MKIHLELNGFLDRYLPDDAAIERATMDVMAGASPSDLIESLGIPPHQVHLVFVDDRLVDRAQWGSRRVVEGEVVAMWPVLAGG